MCWGQVERKSSLNISGYMERTCLFVAFGILMSHLQSVIVCDLGIEGIAFDEPETDMVEPINILILLVDAK